MTQRQLPVPCHNFVGSVSYIEFLSPTMIVITHGYASSEQGDLRVIQLCRLSYIDFLSPTVTVITHASASSEQGDLNTSEIYPRCLRDRVNPGANTTYTS